MLGVEVLCDEVLEVMCAAVHEVLCAAVDNKSAVQFYNSATSSPQKISCNADTIGYSSHYYYYYYYYLQRLVRGWKRAINTLSVRRPQLHNTNK